MMQKRIPACIPPWELAGMKEGSAVLLGFSGGADSTALLDMLVRLREKTPFSLTLAHVDHGIRGEEARRDRQFCEETAARYGLELCILETDIPAIVKESGEGTEEAARRIRYDYFASLMRERHIPILCTAHHADDHFETLLFRLARGTGARGLCGILPARPFGNGMLTRPILSLTRADILAYCRKNNLQYVTDSTNADSTYARNRIRAEVAPVLEQLFPGASHRALRLSEEIFEDETYLRMEAERFLEAYAGDDGLPVDALSALPRAILRRVLAVYAATAQTPEREHVDALIRLVTAPTADMRVALPGGRYAVVEDGCLMLTRARTAPMPELFCIPFGVGNFELSDGTRISVTVSQKPIKVHNLSTPPYINLIPRSDIIKKDAVWRPMRPGDRILQGGMHRRVRRLYAELGFSPAQRRRVPLLACGDEILYAPGIGPCDALRTCPADAPCYCVAVEPIFEITAHTAHQNPANADNGGKKI